MNKTFLTGLFILAFLFSAQPGLCYTINDPVGDRIGDWAFEVYGIDVIRNNSNSITFSLFTNYPQAGYTVGAWNTLPGDLAIDVDRNGTYDYGFALTTHNGITAGHLYNVSAWNLSNSYAPSGYIYNQNQIVTIGSGTDLGVGSFAWNLINPPVGVEGGRPDYRIDVTFDPNLLIGLDGDIGVYWAAATCANDFAQGTASVPEPATLLLLGSGLLGIGIFGRKQFKRQGNL